MSRSSFSPRLRRRMQRSITVYSICELLPRSAWYYATRLISNGRTRRLLALEYFARAGLFGVMLFFAISGYLMAQLAPGSTSLRFMAHRLIGIYPPHWLAVIVVVLATCGAIQPIAAALFLASGNSFYGLDV
jgi:peptidoglycan/LPS O-acetylase OafA/YrhL